MNNDNVHIMFILTKIIIEIIERNKFAFYVKLYYNNKAVKFLVPFETLEALVVSNKIQYLRRFYHEL